MKKILLGSALMSVLLLTGCANTVNHDNFDNIPIQTTSEGLKFKEFTVKGCKYVGTQDENKVWHLAGPNSCAKQGKVGI